MAWEVKKLADIKSITFMRGNGLNKSVLDDNGTKKCILYGDLYTKYAHPIIKKIVNRTNFEGKVKSKKGDVLIPGTTTADAFGIAIARSINEDGIFLGGDINILRTNNEELLSDFLSYYINGPAKWELASYATGTNIMHLSNKKIQNIEVPIPPLPIQKKIVEILDSAFERIAKAKENSEQNLKNAKEVFESYLQKVFENKGKDWEEKEIQEFSKNKDAIVSGPFGSNLKVEHYKESGIPIVRLQNIGKGYFIDKDIKYISNEKAEELKYHSFKSGDLILAKLGIPVGKTCKVPDTFPKGIIVADVVRLRLDPKIISYDFLLFYLNTNLAVSQLTKNISGATRPRVNLSNVREIKISYPKSLEEQKEIVSKLDNLSEQTKQLESIYSQKLSCLEELKQSILQKAFKGELTEVSS
ncbi:hypothetical protein COV13_03290 [Candidatus Woesearchaeota archaeon CG10_big_fil_rev_8_21_14_0_10_32_9]|nr:MAG: hypothetical protein COV13_03290 [Candidatus Woesearchaeota archaeon CG10_big_fil_rev_8_21_14_0_10_32_9]